MFGAVSRENKLKNLNSMVASVSRKINLKNLNDMVTSVGHDINVGLKRSKRTTNSSKITGEFCTASNDVT